MTAAAAESGKVLIDADGLFTFIYAQAEMLTHYGEWLDRHPEFRIDDPPIPYDLLRRSVMAATLIKLVLNS